MPKIQRMEEAIAFEMKLPERSEEKLILLQDCKAMLTKIPVMPSLVKIRTFIIRLFRQRQSSFHTHQVQILPAYQNAEDSYFSDYINAIEALGFELDSRMYRLQQYLLFSDCARKINFVHLCKLKHDRNTKGDTILCTRSKKKRKYNYTFHCKAEAIIELFKTYPMKSNGTMFFRF